jgi:hypothetical protein
MVTAKRQVELIMMLVKEIALNSHNWIQGEVSQARAVHFSRTLYSSMRD